MPFQSPSRPERQHERAEGLADAVGDDFRMMDSDENRPDQRRPAEQGEDGTHASRERNAEHGKRQEGMSQVQRGMLRSGMGQHIRLRGRCYLKAPSKYEVKG